MQREKDIRDAGCLDQQKKTAVKVQHPEELHPRWSIYIRCQNAALVQEIVFPRCGEAGGEGEELDGFTSLLTVTTIFSLQSASIAEP